MAKKDSEETAVIVDGVDILLPATPRLRIPLRSAGDVQRELARLYRQMKAGEIAPADGTKLAYVLNLLRAAIEAGDLEQRIQTLERDAERIRKGWQ